MDRALLSSHRLSIVTSRYLERFGRSLQCKVSSSAMVIQTVCYLFPLLIPEVVRLSTNFDWPKSVLN